MFWLRQVSSEAQGGDVESSPGKSLSEIPPAATCFRVYTPTPLQICFSAFMFYSMMRLVKLRKKKDKNQTPDINSTKPSVPRSLPRRAYSQMRFTTHFGDLTNQPGFSSGLNRWRSSLSGKVPGFLQVCEPFVRVIIPIPLIEAQPGADLSAGTLSSRVQNSSKCCTTCSLCGFW